jgi:hypothetical protein
MLVEIREVIIYYVMEINTYFISNEIHMQYIFIIRRQISTLSGPEKMGVFGMSIHVRRQPRMDV